MDKLKVLLFGMTGFGNSAFKVLMSHSKVELIGVLSREEKRVFPYYRCEPLKDLAMANGVALYENVILRSKKGHRLVKHLVPDLIVVSSFNQIVPEPIISIPRLGIINIHPSLLPKYRGATPTVWVLANGEKETGVTVHFIEDERIDSGRIITQAKYKIKDLDTDGVLRERLAKLSEKVLSRAISLVLTRHRETFPLQREKDATFFPKRLLEEIQRS